MYPIYVKLTETPCRIIGGGRVAERKALGLLEEGAEIRLIAPELTPKLKALADACQIEHLPRIYVPGDLQGAFLVIVATDSPGLNEKIYREAVALGILVNVVDQPENCNFFVPSVFRKNYLQVAVSTQGKAPSLAKAVRESVEKLFCGLPEEELEEIALCRKEIVRQAQGDNGQKKRLMKEILTPKVESWVREAFE